MCHQMTRLHSCTHQADYEKSSLYRDAKVSVLDWDATSCSIVSTSLHSFEGDANISAGLPASPYGPRLLSDPQVQSIVAVCHCYSGYVEWMPVKCIAGINSLMQQPHSTSKPSCALSAVSA